MAVSFSSRTPNEGLAPCPAQMWEEEALQKGWETCGFCQGTGAAIPAGLNSSEHPLLLGSR